MNKTKYSLPLFMKHLAHTLFFASALLLHSCQKTATDAGYEAISDYSEKVHKEYQWDLRGLGGIFGDQIKKFNLDYETIKEVDVQEARRLLVMGVEGLLADINDGKLAPLPLVELPFTYEKLLFGLSFTNPEGFFVAPPHIYYALLIDGHIAYRINTPKQSTRVHKETYEQALEIVKQENAPTSKR